MKRLKFPNRVGFTASPVSTKQRDTFQTTFHNAGGNHAIIIFKKDVSASVPESSNHLYYSNHQELAHTVGAQTIKTKNYLLMIFFVLDKKN